MAGSNKKPPESKSRVFTLEPSQNGAVREMPSITSLLNRKKLSIPKGQSENEVKERKPAPTKKSKLSMELPLESTTTATPVPTPEISLAFEQTSPRIELDLQSQAPPQHLSSPPVGPTMASAPHKPHSTEIKTLIAVPDLELSAETILAPQSPKESTIVKQPPPKPPAKVNPIRAQKDGGKKISYWDSSTLQNSSDLIGRAMSQLLDQGAHSVLFMEIIPPPEGSPHPIFQATSLSGSKKYEALWSGMCWDPGPTPALWRMLLKKGIYELDPKSNFSALRLAFGVAPDEWVSVVRAGPSFNCRGVIAVVSKDSIKAELTQVKKLITTLIKKQESSAA